LNERLGCLVGHHLIADHPEIKNHLKTRVADEKITMIPYGARDVSVADSEKLVPYGVQPKSYALLIARPEPENSILEVVKAFSSQKRNHLLLVLGRYDASNPYHAEVLAAASDEVKFIGAVYDHATLDALRFFASLYVHGHTVGGTNPSLIEALGASQPVLAHNNKFNRWVAGNGAEYFSNVEECGAGFDHLLRNDLKLVEMSNSSRRRFNELFTWKAVLMQYEHLLNKFC
jgi:glycosyltransferase involved in cell wall biosynthesis